MSASVRVPLPASDAARFYGTTPVSELLAWLGEHEARGVTRPIASTAYRSHALAMLGRFDEARSIMS